VRQRDALVVDAREVVSIVDLLRSEVFVPSNLASFRSFLRLLGSQEERDRRISELAHLCSEVRADRAGSLPVFFRRYVGDPEPASRKVARVSRIASCVRYAVTPSELENTF